jgi:pimeloyl-ACP methyl ester carboxylesterase
VDSLQSAHDLDAVRAALGEEKLNYVGYSHGTMMGQEYAESFPHRIRAMVNDGNLDRSIRSAWSGRERRRRCWRTTSSPSPTGATRRTRARCTARTRRTSTRT